MEKNGIFSQFRGLFPKSTGETAIAETGQNLKRIGSEVIPEIERLLELDDESLQREIENSSQLRGFAGSENDISALRKRLERLKRTLERVR